MTRAIDVVSRALKWFPEIMENPGHVITRDEVECYFCADAKMITNGQLKCDGIEGHLQHFRELQKKLRSLRIRFPLEESITNSNECAAYYKIDYVMADGTSGVVHDSALWKIRDGKILRMVESAAFEGPEIPLENHR